MPSSVGVCQFQSHAYTLLLSLTACFICLSFAIPLFIHMLLHLSLIFLNLFDTDHNHFLTFPPVMLIFLPYWSAFVEISNCCYVGVSSNPNLTPPWPLSFSFSLSLSLSLSLSHVLCCMCISSNTLDVRM